MIVLFFITIFTKSNLYQNQKELPTPITVNQKAWKKSGNSFEYTFRGVKFQINRKAQTNAEYQVLLDNELQITINQQTEEEIIYSKTFPYGSHTIKIEGLENFNDEVSYWLSLRAKRIDCNSFTLNSFRTHYDYYPNGVTSSSYGATITKSMLYSKLWIFGAKPSPSKITVQFGSYTEESSWEGDADYNELLYESPNVPLAHNEVKITNSDNDGVYNLYLTFLYILEDLSPEAAAIPFSVSSSYISNENAQKSQGLTCPDNELPKTPCGDVFQTKDKSKATSFTYTFTGVRFQVYGTNGPNYGNYKVLLDDQDLATVSQRKEGDNEQYVLQYTSDIFQYGEHTIKVQAEAGQVIEISKIAYWLSLHAKRINITEFARTGTEGTEYSTESDRAGGLRQFTKNKDITFSYRLSCSKIWIFGSTDSGLGYTTIKFGDLHTSFDERNYNGRKDSIVVYTHDHDFQSDLLTLSTSYTVIINCIYIIDEHATSLPIKVSLYEMDYEPYGKIRTDFADQCSNHVYEEPCGFIFYPNEENILLKVFYKFTGVRFQLIGCYNQKNKRFSVYVDGEFYAKINERNPTSSSRFDHLYTSNLLPYGEHTIQISNDELDHFELVGINYWITMNAKRIDYSGFSITDSQWESKTDDSGGLTYLSKSNPATLTIPLTCNKFWIVGSKAFANSIDFDVKYDGKEFSEQFNQKLPHAVIYESPELSLKAIDLIIIAKTLSTRFNYVYYLDELSPTQAFTYSVPFSESKQFSFTSYFTQTDGFSNSFKFSETGKFSDTDQFSETGGFSNTKQFTKTDGFSNTRQFTKTDGFSNTQQFTKTDGFSNTQQFTKTNGFSNTLQFSKSDEINTKLQFSSTQKFSQSEKFSNSFYFSNSALFYNSVDETTNNKDFSDNDETSSISKEFNSEAIPSSENYVVSSSSDENVNLDTLSPIPSNSTDVSDGNVFLATKKKNKAPMIIGIIVGVIAFIILVIVIIFLIFSKKSKDDSDVSEIEGNSENETESTQVDFENPLFVTNTEQNDPFVGQDSNDESLAFI